MLIACLMENRHCVYIDADVADRQIAGVRLRIQRLEDQMAAEDWEWEDQN